MTPLLSVKGARKSYQVRKSWKETANVKALNGVSFDLLPGETLAIVGESGCGKSTLARYLMRLEKPSGGELEFEGKNAFGMTLPEYYQKIQMVFQDPYGSLNPRRPVWKIISEPLMVNTKTPLKDCKKIACELMEKVGLRASYADRYPHMFSGGQRQRIGLARALVLKPKVLICDEPVSALDVSVQAQVLNLLVDLQKELNLSMIFISHDLSVVRHIADRIMVMYFGEMVELGLSRDVFERPMHPYTQALLKSTPGLAKSDFKPIKGELPSPLKPPSGCPFAGRCERALEICSSVKSRGHWLNDQEGHSVEASKEHAHWVSCHLY